MSGTRGKLGPRSIVMGTITRGQVNVDMVVPIIQLLTRSAASASEISAWLPEKAGPYLDDGRNATISKAIAAEANGDIPPWDVFLFIDSDMVDYTYEDVLAVCTEAHRRQAVVGGLYQGVGRDGVLNMAFKYNPQTEPHNLCYTSLTHTIGNRANPRPPTPLKVDAVATGFMAIPRPIIDAMPPDRYGADTCRWFDEPLLDTGFGIAHLGEDLAFCHRVKSMGYDVYIHRGVRIRHAKTMILDPN